jgi:deferrochelatase/peroxidase EfeB
MTEGDAMSDDHQRGSCPARPAHAGDVSLSRRNLLKGLGAAGLAIGGVQGVEARDHAQRKLIDPQREAGRSKTFYGRHQPGILTPPQPAAVLASFDVLADGVAELDQLLRVLTARATFLMSGGTPPAIDDRFPPPDSGILGPRVHPFNLTITLAVGASLFDERYGLAELKPRHLVAMTDFPNDALDAERCHGDLMVQICADRADATIHALRDLVKNTPDLLALRWTQDGFLPSRPPVPLGKGETPRNLLGFKDGTANLEPTSSRVMDDLVWIAAGSGEPAWTAGGSYQVVRIIRQFVERWDRTPLGEQEEIIGRQKDSGAPLGMRHETDIPDYAGDPGGKQMPLDAHIRLANPRNAKSARSRIYRRPYNYMRGTTTAGQLDMGLLFVCFQSNLTEGFIAIQSRLNGEPLEEYIKPVGGGYFFALPGVTRPGDYYGRALMEAAQSLPSTRISANPSN